MMLSRISSVLAALLLCMSDSPTSAQTLIPPQGITPFAGSGGSGDGEPYDTTAAPRDISTNTTDIDECFEGTDNCHPSASCINTPGSFNCTCNTGFTGSGINCSEITDTTQAWYESTMPTMTTTSDIDECREGTDNCHPNASCINTPGSFNCTCNTGFTGNGINCSDINECFNGTEVCDPSRSCVNTAGSFICICNTGFTGSGINCSDIDECSEGTDNCHSSASCINTPGSFNCTCNRGFTGSGINCSDIDECLEGTDNCHLNASCINAPGSFNCVCNTGFTGSGINCSEITNTTQAWEETTVPIMTTSSETTDIFAATTPGVVTDTSNFSVSGTTTVATTIFVDSETTVPAGGYCETYPNRCDNGGTCSSIIDEPYFECTCTSGYSGTICNVTTAITTEAPPTTLSATTDSTFEHTSLIYTNSSTTPSTALESTTTFRTSIETTAAPTCNETCDDECDSNRTCECISEICTEVCPICVENAECVFLQCQCKSGYMAVYDVGMQCHDIDECGSNVCNGTGQSCENLPGTYQCTCLDNYIPSPTGNDCIDDSCSPSDCGGNAGCLGNSKQCMCFVGYTGDPNSEAGCYDIDECVSEFVSCSEAEICINTDGSYYCDCISGYVKSGDECVPIRCEAVRIPCDSRASLCNSASNSITDITFPATLGGYSTKSSSVCGDSTSSAGIPLGSRSCSLQGSWGTVTWLSSCGDEISTVASGSIENEQDRQEVSASLEILTSEPQTVDSDEVTSTTEAITNVTKSASKITPPTATSVVNTISNVMESPGLDASGQSSQLRAQLDLVASLVILENDEPYQAVSNNVSMFVTQSNSSAQGIGLAMFVRPNTTSMGFRSDQFTITHSPETSGSIANNGQRVQSAIYIPAGAMRISSKTSFYVFGNANLFNVSNSSISKTYDESPQSSSIVISATVENETITDLPPDSLVTYSFPLEYNETQETASCVFWSEDEMNWSDAGCNVVQSNNMDILDCTCNHLTNFAALLRPIPDDPNNPAVKALDIITIVGCSISSCALVILVLIFICFPQTRSGRKFRASFLLMNLSCALLGLNITLIASEMPSIINPENYDDIKSSCIAIAVFLHLFLLASCAWMNCEGAMLFLAVIKPLYMRTQLQSKTVVIYSVLWGWTMPVIFVSIVAGADHSVYQCWIQPSYIVYLAVIPTAIMIGSNLVVYGLLTYYLCRNPKAGWGKTWRSTRESQKRKLGVNLSILLLLGLTWIFGFFLAGIADETTALVFAYIFTILNSLQGFFLLLLYILRNKEARHILRKEISSIYDKIALSNSSAGEARRGRRYSTGVTDTQSSRDKRVTDPPGSTVFDGSRRLSTRSRPQHDSPHV